MKFIWKKAAVRGKKLWKDYAFYLLALLFTAAVGLLCLAARSPGAGKEPLPAPVPAPASQSLDQPMARTQKEKSPLIWPVSGREILTPHSPDTLVWRGALRAYAAHNGVDIGCTLGEAVLCAMDGRVTALYKDPLMGNTIEVSHEGDMRTKYANLSTLNLVKAGQYVRAGEAISAVGASAALEEDMPPHLHFEAWQGEAWLALPQEED